MRATHPLALASLALLAGCPEPTEADPTAAYDTERLCDLTPAYRFLGASSYAAPNRALVSWTWEFGDGRDPALGQTVDHRFPEDGSYSVTLTVEDDQGATDAVTETLDAATCLEVVEASLERDETGIDPFARVKNISNYLGVLVTFEIGLLDEASTTLSVHDAGQLHLDVDEIVLVRPVEPVGCGTCDDVADLEVRARADTYWDD